MKLDRVSRSLKIGVALDTEIRQRAEFAGLDVNAYIVGVLLREVTSSKLPDG